MSKTSENTNRHFKKFLAIFVLFSLVVFASELVYQLPRNPRLFVYGFFKNVPVLASQSQLAGAYNGIVAKSLYAYFSRLDKLYPPGEACSPFCLEYQEEQTYLELYKRLLSKDAFGAFTDTERARLYFWIANINIWHQDDQTTLEWLERGLSLLADKNYQEFYEDLRDLDSIHIDPGKREYFIQKLNSLEENAPRYQRIYLAKASYNLAHFFLNTQDLEQASKFAQTSVSLNPWNIDYYLLLSDINISRNDLKTAREAIVACMARMRNDSGPCKEKLIQLDY